MILLVLLFLKINSIPPSCQEIINSAKSQTVIDLYRIIYQKCREDALGIPCILPIIEIKGSNITRGFGLKNHPIIKKIRNHNGVDISCKNTAIVATANGMVSFVGFEPAGLGNYIKIKHHAGYETFYAHLSEITIKTGESIKIGQQIGVSGSTGLSTGDHLHYEVHRYGKTENPIDYLLLLYNN